MLVFAGRTDLVQAEDARTPAWKRLDEEPHDLDSTDAMHSISHAKPADFRGFDLLPFDRWHRLSADFPAPHKYRQAAARCPTEGEALRTMLFRDIFVLYPTGDAFDR